MKKIILAVSTLCGLLLGTTTVAGPISQLYLSNYGSTIKVVQGNAIINSWSTVNGNEWALNVDGDVRTNLNCSGCNSLNAGAQYTLGGVYTGVNYAYPVGVGGDADDSTTDGSYNYTVSYANGNVYRMNRDFSNPVALFNLGSSRLGITYDETNNSLWVSEWSGTLVRDFSMTGQLLSSFSTGHTGNGGLALDHADQTLWLVDNANGSVLQQYSKTGQLLSTGIAVGYTLGAEFDFAGAQVPEPTSLALLSLGLAGLGFSRRRKQKAA